MSTPLTQVYADVSAVASAAAEAVLGDLAKAIAERGVAHAVLTGGGAGIASLAAMAASPALSSVDFSKVHLWWGDERFLPAGHADRNDTQARDALLTALLASAERGAGGLSEAAVHAMPTPEQSGDSVDIAAGLYANELREFAPAGSLVPAFDVLMLGVGPDGHVASLFPGHPAREVIEHPVIGVRGSPKPPPERVSLTFPSINQARRIYLLAAGAEKAAAVASCLGAPVDGEEPLPATQPRGRDATIWMLDEASAPA